MSFIVKQQHFEGPLDLLLSLIEKRKLFVNDIALAQVTDDYIAHIQSHGILSLHDSANFILVASTLLLIKSKSLLPELALTEEEEQGIDDLQKRLKIYQEIKHASVHIKTLFGHELIFLPSQSRPVTPLFSPDASMTLGNLGASIRSIVNALPKKELLPQVIVQKVVSLEETITRLSERVATGLRMSFREFSGPVTAERKVNIIVSFLAMLELVKQGIISVTQEYDGADIQMESKS